MPHTPGPWKCGKLNNQFMIMQLGCEGEDTQRWDGFIYGIENENDARLIAAAPLMLDALKIAYNVSMRQSEIEYGVRSSDVDWVSMAKNFKSIIDKAEGKK